MQNKEINATQYMNIDRKAIRKQAEALLDEQYYKEKNERYIDVVKMAMDLGFDVGNADLDDLEDGFLAIWEDDKRAEHRVIGVNKNLSLYCKRFTIAHEIAHFVMHYDPSQGRAYLHRDNRKKDDVKEIEADFFAANLLMPDNIFKMALQELRDKGCTDNAVELILSREFGVPPKSIRKRIKEVAQIDRFYMKDVPKKKNSHNKRDADRTAGSFVSCTNFQKAGDEQSLDFRDPYMTQQQKLRDAQVTELLLEYVSSYKHKSQSSVCYRRTIMVVCVASIAVFLYGICRVLCNNVFAEESAIQYIVLALSSNGAFIAGVIGVLRIITRYFFPEDEERYITDIVKAIQQNDLDNKKVNVRSQIINSPHKSD